MAESNPYDVAGMRRRAAAEQSNRLTVSEAGVSMQARIDALEAETRRLRILVEKLHDWYRPTGGLFPQHEAELDRMFDLTEGEMSAYWYREACAALGVGPVEVRRG